MSTNWTWLCLEQIVTNLSEAQKILIAGKKKIEKVRQFLAVFKPFPEDAEDSWGESKSLDVLLRSDAIKEAKRLVLKMAQIGSDEGGYEEGVEEAGGTKKSDVRALVVRPVLISQLLHDT